MCGFLHIKLVAYFVRIAEILSKQDLLYSAGQIRARDKASIYTQTYHIDIIKAHI